MRKEVHTTLMQGGTVSPGTSENTAIADLSEGSLTGSILFSIGGSGSPEVVFQVYEGEDASGNKVWLDLATDSGSAAGSFDLGATRVSECRLKITETGGTNSLDKVNVYTNLASRAE